MTFDLPIVLQRVAAAGHRVFTTGRYNVNIVGVRNPDSKPDQFDDRLHVVYLDDFNQWCDLSFRCTTDPGLHYLLHPINKAGTAILKPGQYRSAYRIGLHRGSYPALVQAGPVTVYRDRNRDTIHDMDSATLETGHFGVNIHHAGDDSTVVSRWSAGCTVVANRLDWEIFLTIIHKSASLYGDRFTYTLIEGNHAGKTQIS